MTFDEEMAAGEQALRFSDYRRAYQAFCRAHDAGHPIKRNHLAAHRDMIRAAAKAGRLDRAAQNVVLMSAAFLFDRDRSNTTFAT